MSYKAPIDCWSDTCATVDNPSRPNLIEGILDQKWLWNNDNTTRFLDRKDGHEHELTSGILVNTCHGVVYTSYQFVISIDILQ